ncbi:MAG: DUF4013 domain-containing protein [Candidatus Bathyarchaeia archaeon]
MDLGKNLGEAYDYTRAFLSDVGRLILLIVLGIIPIVNLIVAGYLYRIMGEPPVSKEPPPLKDYGETWVKGLKILVVALVYFIIPAILTVPLLWAWVAPFRGWYGAWYDIYPRPPMAPSAFAFWAFPLFFVGILVAFFIAFFLAMAIVNMAKHDNLGKAFAFSEIWGVITRVGVGSYLLWLIVIFILCVVVGALGSVPYIGWLISLAVSPILGVFVARSASLVYSEGAPPEIEAVPPEEEAPPKEEKPTRKKRPTRKKKGPPKK